MNTIPARASRTQEYDLEEDDAYYIQRPHTSAVRITHPRQQVIQRGNKRIIIHDEPPPSKRGKPLAAVRRHRYGVYAAYLVWRADVRQLVDTASARQHVRYAPNLPDRSGCGP